MIMTGRQETYASKFSCTDNNSWQICMIFSLVQYKIVLKARKISIGQSSRNLLLIKD